MVSQVTQFSTLSCNQDGPLENRIWAFSLKQKNGSGHRAHQQHRIKKEPQSKQSAEIRLVWLFFPISWVGPISQTYLGPKAQNLFLTFFPWCLLSVEGFLGVLVRGSPWYNMDLLEKTRDHAPGRESHKTSAVLNIKRHLNSRSESALILLCSSRGEGTEQMTTL